MENNVIKSQFQPLVFKIYVNISEVNIEQLINTLLKCGDIIFDGSIPVVFLFNGVSKQDLSNRLLTGVTQEFFCEPIKPEQCTGGTDIVSVWYVEQYEKHFADFIEKEKVATLKKIRKNIKKANALIDKRLAEAKASERDMNN